MPTSVRVVNEFKGPKGRACVYQGEAHDWVMEFWAKGTRKRLGKHVRRVFKNSARQAAIVVAKQMTGVFEV